MNKKTIIFSIIFILLLFLTTNSILITSASAIILLFIFIKQRSLNKKIDEKNLESTFFHAYYDELNQDHEISILNLYENLKIDLNNQSLIPINKESEKDILENLKVYFNDDYFNAFYRIFINDEIKEKKKIILCLLEKFFKKEKNQIQQNIKMEKNNDKSLKILFICLLAIILVRFLFSKYYLLYSSSIVGICSLTIISIIAFITYKNYLNSIFERKSYEKY